jgi:segregation and condensation protein B
MNLKNQIEALLFLTDKPIKAAVIARTLNADTNDVRKAMIELINEFEARNGAIEIADEDGYMMQVKDEFANLVDEFSPFEMPTALVRTLSAIAIKQPVPQSEIIKIRGAGAYDHIKELLQRELIHRKEDGRSPLLTTTKKFQEYFRLSKDGQTWRHELEKATNKDRDPDEQIEIAKTVQLDVFDASPAPGEISELMVGQKSDQVQESKPDLELSAEEIIESAINEDIHVFDTAPQPQDDPSKSEITVSNTVSDLAVEASSVEA